MKANVIELIGIEAIQQKVKALRDTPFEHMMLGDIGMFAMSSIKKRTVKGEDANGLSFAPYSAGYAKDREKHSFPVKPVDLTRTGSMLSSMTYNTNRNFVEIFFMNTQGPSAPGYPNKERNPVKAFFLQKDRDFFSLSKKDVQGIMGIVDAYYSKLINGKGKT